MYECSLTITECKPTTAFWKGTDLQILSWMQEQISCISNYHFSQRRRLSQKSAEKRLLVPSVHSECLDTQDPVEQTDLDYSKNSEKVHCSVGFFDHWYVASKMSPNKNTHPCHKKVLGSWLISNARHKVMSAQQEWRIKLRRALYIPSQKLQFGVRVIDTSWGLCLQTNDLTSFFTRGGLNVTNLALSCWGGRCHVRSALTAETQFWDVFASFQRGRREDSKTRKREVFNFRAKSCNIKCWNWLESGFQSRQRRSFGVRRWRDLAPVVILSKLQSPQAKLPWCSRVSPDCNSNSFRSVTKVACHKPTFTGTAKQEAEKTCQLSMLHIVSWIRLWPQKRVGKGTSTTKCKDAVFGSSVCCMWALEWSGWKACSVFRR